MRAASDASSNGPIAGCTVDRADSLGRGRLAVGRGLAARRVRCAVGPGFSPDSVTAIDSDNANPLRLQRHARFGSDFVITAPLARKKPRLVVRAPPNVGATPCAGSRARVAVRRSSPPRPTRPVEPFAAADIGRPNGRYLQNAPATGSAVRLTRQVGPEASAAVTA